MLGLVQGMSTVGTLYVDEILEFREKKGIVNIPNVTEPFFQEWNYRHADFGHISGNRVRIGVSGGGNYFGFAIPSRTRKRIGASKA